MTVAVFLDFQVAISRREGIMTYVGYLFNGLLECDDELNIEIWLYNDNLQNFKNEFSDILDKYSSRVKVFDERNRKNYRKAKYKHKIKSVLYDKISKMLYCFGLQTLGDIFYQKIELHKNLFERSLYDFTNAFNSLSKADCVFVPFPGLTQALKINKPIVMQIHDLFTFPLINLFVKETFPRANYIKQNKKFKKIIYKYAKKNTIFVCSSTYTRDTQILRYIDNIEMKQCKVIPFPPMYTDFGRMNILSETEFRKKYNIDYKYLAFPSQNRPNKNLITLLKALNILRNEGINLTLVTTGKMSHCNSTAKYVKDNMMLVREIGNLSREDLCCLYKYSELVACPNIIEGMGISGQCLEAISAGKAVTHARSMGIEDSLKSRGLDIDSVNLFWFDSYDEKQLAERIKQILQDTEKAYNGQIKILEAYNSITWSDVGKEYISIFNEIKNCYC